MKRNFTGQEHFEAEGASDLRRPSDHIPFVLLSLLLPRVSVGR